MAESAALQRDPRSRWLSHRSRLAEFTGALVSILFPAPCRLCDQLLTSGKRVPICDSCIGSFSPVPSSICQICGRPLPGLAGSEPENQICPACRDKTYAFERARSWALYDGALVHAILLLKFERIDPLAKLFVDRLAQLVRQDDAMAADMVVPVPLHHDRQGERGYNQADLVARPLAKKLGLSHHAALLARTRPRPDKHLLSLEERWTSVRGAFATRSGSQVDNQRVLLVDDVFTTGATLDACARALREAGAKSVLGLTVARAITGSVRATSKSYRPK
jgi:competence protein ComFC